MKNLRIGFVILVIFFLITRIFKIAEVPSSLYWDEASIAVNSYSLISNSGKDEWGDFLPIHFRAFSEFKLPVFIYASAISSLVFGLSEYSVRLTSVAFSLGCVLLVGFLSFQLTKNRIAAIISAFLMTISPWFFIFSRTGYEATAGLFFYLAGICSILLYKNKNHLFILISVFCFITAMYSYNSYRLLSPLTLVVLFFINFNKVNLKKYLIVSFLSSLIFFASLVPIARLFLFDSGLDRVQGFSLFPTIKVVSDSKGKHLQFVKNQSTNQNWQESLGRISINYLSHFSPDFLFVNGDKNVRSHVPGMGQLYILDLLFLCISLYLLVKKRDIKILFFCGLIFLGILPASLFKEAPHALRSLTAAPFFVILVSLGVYFIYSKSKNLGVIILCTYLILFAVYYYNFINNYNKNYSSEWQQGYKEIFTSESREFNKYDSIVVTNQFAQPYIFGLFYLKYPLNNFRNEVAYTQYQDWGFSTVSKFNKFYFMKVDEAKLPKGRNLVFTSLNDKLKDREPIKVINNNLPKKDWLFVYEYENK